MARHDLASNPSIVPIPFIEKPAWVPPDPRQARKADLPSPTFRPKRRPKPSHLGDGSGAPSSAWSGSALGPSRAVAESRTVYCHGFQGGIFRESRSASMSDHVAKGDRPMSLVNVLTCGSIQPAIPTRSHSTATPGSCAKQRYRLTA